MDQKLKVEQKTFQVTLPPGEIDGYMRRGKAYISASQYRDRLLILREKLEISKFASPETTRIEGNIEMIDMILEDLRGIT